MIMKRYTMLLTEEQLNQLEQIRKETGCPVSETIRRSIDAYLIKKGKDCSDKASQGEVDAGES